MEKIRTFISIDLPKLIQKELKKIQDLLPGFTGKKTEPENLHLTLKFLGEIDGERIIEIKKRLKEIEFKSFECTIDSLGVFSKKRIRIVWVHLSNCNKLQRAVDEKLTGLFEKEHRFMSHVTIARVKSIKHKNYFLGELKKVKIPLLKFKVNSFKLKKSTLTPEGPVYEILKEYKAD
jgi:2'-5' RNA ligase